MNSQVCLALLLSMGSVYQTITNAVLMEKLANSKTCADDECSYALSLAIALDDFMAPDCRFINIKKGQTIYVYSKLTPEEGAGVFWSGSVYSERYVDQMGILGYFPSNLVKETVKFKKNTDTVMIPTTDVDFYCF
ncbi:otoraplin [Esox lucius]|uniref:SH3 domain-containing protein n=1 Tax=Esox lucius TaxID=8010 RepID=A0AAY5K428_ESOLU|nr:otoraplin [Esox lucius]XP_034148568.1 otoraplin [Esox lucius]